jgi:hypothetical protein
MNHNVEKVFNSILVEIDKFENNIDFKELGCKKIFECFVKYENKLTCLVYFTIIIQLVIINYFYINYK